MALEPAVGFEQRIGFRDRHRIYGVLERKLTHGRQRGARRELTTGDQTRDLLDELPIDRDSGLGLEHEHSPAAVWYMCITTLIHTADSVNGTFCRGELRSLSYDKKQS